MNIIDNHISPEANKPYTKALIAVVIVMLLFGIAIKLNSANQQHKTSYLEPKGHSISSLPLNSSSGLTTELITEFYNEMSAAYLEASNNNSSMTLDEYVQAYFLKGATITFNIIKIDVPTDALVFESYSYYADEYAWVFDKDRYKTNDTSMIRSDAKINLNQDEKRADLTYTYITTTLLSPDYYTSLKEPLNIKYNGTCKLDLTLSNTKELKAASEHCDVTVSGFF